MKDEIPTGSTPGSGRGQSGRRNRRSAIAVGFLVVCFGILAFSLPAQEPTDSEIAVNVGVSAAKQGDLIDLPLTLSAPENSKVVSVISEISFPKKQLTYTESERGLAAEISEAEVSVKPKDGSDASVSVLEVSIGGKQALKPGILAYLKFTVADDAPKGELALKVLSTQAKSEGGESVEMAKGKDGEVTVFLKTEEIPVVGCFFFTH